MTRQQRGFTLIELMIALSLAGLLIAGAFQIHAVFTTQSMRQKSVNDMQQSLRIAMQTIERSIRAGGVGMMNGKMQTSLGCGGQPRTFFRVQYYNRNYWSSAFPTQPPNNTQPAAGFAPASANLDPDPDILRVISMVDDGAAVNASADDGNTATLASTSDLSTSIKQDDVLLFNNTSPSTLLTAHGCMRQVSNNATLLSAGPIDKITVPHSSAYSGTATQLCTNNEATCLAAVTYVPSAIVRHFRNQTIFRIQDAANAQDSPKLVVATVPIGDLPAQPTWTVLADDVEDMQIALLLDDGTVCNDREDPTAKEVFNGTCDPAHATAVRITLVARTPQGSPGPVTNQQGQRGGYEDQAPSSNATDNRLRRALTSEITLRN